MLRAMIDMAVKRDSSLTQDELECQADNPPKRQRPQAADENDSCGAASPLGPWTPPPGYVPPWDRDPPWAPSPDADGNVKLEVLEGPFYLNGQPFIFEAVAASCVPEDECRHAEGLDQQAEYPAIGAPGFHDIDPLEPSHPSVAKEGRKSMNGSCWQAHLSTDDVQVFSTWTAVPSPYLQRLEWVTERFPEPDFDEKLEDAFRASENRQIVRTYRYGADVAAEWKRGSTPEEVRQEYAATAEARLEASPTPSPTMHIGEWQVPRFLGHFGATICAATNTRSLEVVAVKQLGFPSTHSAIADEVAAYNTISSTTCQHRYSRFLLRKHSILTIPSENASMQKTLLLYQPLALGTFSEFGLHGRWEYEPPETKIKLFTQILLGLSALRENGWIHRNLNPRNLGAVEIGPDARAVILDFGHAVPAGSCDCRPRPQHCGSVGYLAPELESTEWGPTYDQKVDVWSMGVVGLEMLYRSNTLWNLQHKIFVGQGDAEEQSLERFRSVQKMLIQQPADSFANALGQMLVQNPRERPSVEEILEHPAVATYKAAIDAEMSAVSQPRQGRPVEGEPSSSDSAHRS